MIRAHPDEARPGKESLESVADWVRRSEVDRLPNVLFVRLATSIFSSYELIQRSKFVMVYNSTIGLEASLLGAAGAVRRESALHPAADGLFPGSAEEYRQQPSSSWQPRKWMCRRNTAQCTPVSVLPAFRTSLPFDAFIEEDGIWQGYVQA